MEVTKLFNGTYVIEPKIFYDERGHFFESFNEEEFNLKTGENFYPVQDNESYSKRGVFRGMHFQAPPYEQAKLVRVVSGCAMDFAVDLRVGSPTYGKWSQCYLSSDNHKQFFIPKGFAHGFLAITNDVIFQYKCDNYYNKESEMAISYKSNGITDEEGVKLCTGINKCRRFALCDDKLVDELILSDKDKQNPLLKDIKNPFKYHKKNEEPSEWNELRKALKSALEGYSDILISVENLVLKERAIILVRDLLIENHLNYSKKGASGNIFMTVSGKKIVVGTYGNVETLCGNRYDCVIYFDIIKRLENFEEAVRATLSDEEISEIKWVNRPEEAGTV